MAAPLTNEQYDNIVTLKESGLATMKIASILGIHDSSVRNIWNIYAAVRDGSPLPKFSQHYTAAVRWATEKTGKTVAEPAAPAKEDNTALAFASLLEAVKGITAAVDAIDKRLSAMQMTIAGARGDACENAKKIVEAINVNGDIQTKEWQAIKEKLDAIKTNTKRRGYNE